MHFRHEGSGLSVLEPCEENNYVDSKLDNVLNKTLTALKTHVYGTKIFQTISIFQAFCEQDFLFAFLT